MSKPDVNIVDQAPASAAESFGFAASGAWCRSSRLGRTVVIWRVDVVFLAADDWKYEGSAAAQGKGGRTHTFGVMNPATKLADAAAYALPGIVIKNGKPVLG